MGYRHSLRIALPALAIALFTGCGSSPPPPVSFAAAIQEAEDAAYEALRGGETTSVGIAISTSGETVWSQSFGMADVARGIPVGPATRFGIGSVSKMFAAAAVMQLVEQGRLRLEDPVVRHLPTFHMIDPRYRDITVGMLLDHTSGLPGTVFRDGFQTATVASYADEALATFGNERLRAAPGYEGTYCNDGFTLSEKVIEAVSGMPFVEYVRRSILVPLGMRHSAFPLTSFPAGSFAAYHVGGVPMPQEFVTYGAGGLYSTPDDLAAFARLFLGAGAAGSGAVLSPLSVTTMAVDRTTGTFDPVPSAAETYGLGWDTVADPALGQVGVLGWGKNGGSFYYQAQLLVAPSQGLAVVVMGPTGRNFNALAVAHRVMLRALQDLGTIVAFPAPLPPVAPPPVEPPPGFAAYATGTYASTFEILRLVQGPAGSTSFSILSLEEDGTFTTRDEGLRYRTDGWLASDASPLRAFRVVGEGASRYLALREPSSTGAFLDQSAHGQRMEGIAAPLSAAWRTRVGRSWLVVNESPDSLMLRFGKSPRLTVTTVPELPGLVIATPPLGTGRSPQVVNPTWSDDRAAMMLVIPGNHGRNLEDLEILVRQGEEWTRSGGYVNRPLETVPRLPVGATTSVPMGPEGWAEWRSVPLGGSAMPVTVTGARAWRTYGSAFEMLEGLNGDGTFTFPAVSQPGLGWLLLHGPAGGTVTVTTGP